MNQGKQLSNFETYGMPTNGFKHNPPIGVGSRQSTGAKKLTIKGFKGINLNYQRDSGGGKASVQTLGLCIAMKWHDKLMLFLWTEFCHQQKWTSVHICMCSLLIGSKVFTFFGFLCSEAAIA